MTNLLDAIRTHGDNEKKWRDSNPSTESYIDQKKGLLEELEKKDGFFIRSLMADRAFLESAHFKTLNEYAHDLATKYKRSAVFYLTLVDYLRIKGCRNEYTANGKSVSKVLNDYMADLTIIKERRGIKRVQFPKIAGLMANLIVKYRPIVPLDRRNDPNPDINENFAIYHAISICAGYDGGSKDMKIFENTHYYKAFYKEVGYLLKRNFTPESLISVFKTLCQYQFPKALEEPASE
jgi:hypothetical protein